MEFHTIIIEVVEHGKTGLIPLSVVRLRSSSSASVRPLNIVVIPAAWPSDVPPAHAASSPEESLTLSSHKVLELSLLGVTVNTQGPHAIGPAETVSLLLGEATAPNPPAHQEVLSSKLVIGRMSSSTSPP